MKRQKVLVIEDNGDLRLMLRDALEDAGFEVAAAADGAAGLELQKTRPAEVVVTDLLMPEKEGIETIAELADQLAQGFHSACGGADYYHVLLRRHCFGHQDLQELNRPCRQWLPEAAGHTPS